MRLAAQDDVTRSFILRTVSTPNSLDYHASELNLAPVLLGAAVDTRGGDSRGVMRYDEWFNYDVRVPLSPFAACSAALCLRRELCG